jgi:hypothetical protein
MFRFARNVKTRLERVETESPDPDRVVSRGAFAGWAGAPTLANMPVTSAGCVTQTALFETKRKIEIQRVEANLRLR